MPFSNQTVTYSESVQGFPSFYSYIPEKILGMNGFLYTFKNGNLYQHNDNTASRNNYYGTQFNSTLLNQMTGSLTTQSKPVVRQAAKFFLEQYLGRTIPYNPVKPGGSITRVITEVHKMVAEKQRRSAR